MKKLTSLILALMMCVGMLVSVAAPISAAKFTDVADGQWYTEAVAWAAENEAHKKDVHIVNNGLNLYGEYYDFGYDKCVFVGTKAEESGILQGEMIGEYVRDNFSAVDINGDGEISYILFKGEEGNAEAIARTQFGVEDADAVLTAAGKAPLEYFDAQAAQKWQTDPEGAWSAKAAKDYMDTNLVTFNESNGNMIELVICNNDGMAEGVVASLQAAGYNAAGQHIVPVFGVDATDAAKALIAEGSMIGTVKQDANGMAVAICETVKAIAGGKTPVDALASLTDERLTVAGDCAGKLYVSYAPYTGE